MSRIIVKNLSKHTSEKDLRTKFEECGTLTDVKLICKDGSFRRYAFVGFQSSMQAENAVSAFNKTYFLNSKIDVELAKNLSDAERPKAWKDKQVDLNEVQAKREAQKQFRIQLSHIRQAGNNINKRNKLIAKYKNDPNFKLYLELTTGNSDILAKLTEIDDRKDEANVDQSSNKSDNDEGIVADEIDTFASNQSVSDANYWQSLVSKTEDICEKSNLSPKKVTHKKHKKTRSIFTLRLRIDKFPKKDAKQVKHMKQKGLSKPDIKQFFLPIPVSCSNIEKHSKNKFEYLIHFKSEKLLKEAQKKDGSFLSVNKSSSESVMHKCGSAPWAEAADRLEKAEPVTESGRLFIRNLSYDVTEDLLREKFAAYGEIVNLDLPICKQTRKLKGFATVTFLNPANAVVAMNELDSSDLLGRLMHVMPALPEEVIDDLKGPRSSFKVQQAKEKRNSEQSWHNWNTLFVSSVAVADIVAKRLNKTKEDLFDSGRNQSVAVTQALGETQIVNEIRKFLEDQGVSVEAFSDPNVERSNTVLLVKNLPAGTKATDIAELFGKWGELGRVILPPSGVTCIVEFLNETEARKAYRNMRFRRFGHVPLYIEKAPLKTFLKEYKKPAEIEKNSLSSNGEEQQEKRKRSETDNIGYDNENNDTELKKKTKLEIPDDHTTIYVTNLPLDATKEAITEHFSHAGEIFDVVIAMKGQQSRGYGFVQYLRQVAARKALVSLEGSTLGGRNISLKLSEKKLSSHLKSTRHVQDFGEQKSAKISVKNIPFQATKVDVEQLFRPFGAMKRVFLRPHHSGQFNNGGYGFIEYISKDDAKRALETLGLSTHLLGRRLVLQWANPDESVEELRQKTAKKQLIVQSLGLTHKKMKHAMINKSGQEFQKDYDYD